MESQVSAVVLRSVSLISEGSVLFNVYVLEVFFFFFAESQIICHTNCETAVLG